MNIFTHLGLDESYRKEAKVTQLVKHYDEVTEKNKVGKVYGVQLKEDGVCAITVVVDGVATIFSRTGRLFTNTGVLSSAISNRNLGDGVYFGEMVCDLVSLEVLSGVTNPNRVNPVTSDKPGYVVLNNLKMRFFDLLSIQDFVEGKSSSTYRLRSNDLAFRFMSNDLIKVAYGKSNSNPLIYTNSSNAVLSIIPYQVVESENEMNHILNFLISGGEEGIVIIDLDAGWEAGHKGWRKMKKVRGVDYDLMCIGYEEGTGKYAGKVANLIFNWKNGTTIKCMLGKGWTHDLAEEMFKCIKASDYLDRNATLVSVKENLRYDFNNPVGSIFQVYALEESSKGKLRLAKVGEKRHDKNKADV
tara:strand:- start:19609 stop:20682 length:1074 start_codon:yes stop_codon:yes gene_type:complete